MVISLKSTESWSSRSNRSKTPVHTVQPVHGPITERPALGYTVQPVHWTGSPAACILHWSSDGVEPPPIFTTKIHAVIRRGSRQATSALAFGALG